MRRIPLSRAPAVIGAEDDPTRGSSVPSSSSGDDMRSLKHLLDAEITDSTRCGLFIATLVVVGTCTMK
jgi:hypothetical protein